MLNEEDIQEILNDLYSFYQSFVAVKYDSCVEAEHIDILSMYLMDVYFEEYQRLCVSMPPRHSKSSMVTLAFPLWLIFQNPKLNILIVNAESNLSEKFGIKIREAIKEYGIYFNVYLSDVKHASTHIMFEDKDGRSEERR